MPEIINCEVFLIGRYFCDLVFTGLPEFPRLGHEVYSSDFHLVPGGVYTPAVALHRLGVQVVWPCTFGSDPFSQYVKTQALEEGISDSWFTDLDTPSLRITTAFSFKNERAFLSYTDMLPPYKFGALIRESSPQWIYITHLLLGKELEGVVSVARDVGSKVYMDCQAHNHSIEEPLIQDGLCSVDIFSPNLAEARMLTGKEEIEEVMDKLLRFAPAVLIKDGANGCYYKDGSQSVHTIGIDVQAVDTTGAGDNFNSGYLYAQVRGRSIEESLRIANICGGLSVQGFGGTTSSPSEAELMKLLTEIGLK